MVVMERDKYRGKVEELLNQPTYNTIPTDPTIKQKNKPKTLLQNIKAERGINKTAYRRMYLTESESSKFYGLPNIHKIGSPPETTSFQ